MLPQNQAAVFLAAIGSFFFIMNWLIVIHNKRGGKWSSPVPPLGGLLIFIAGLISTVKPLALIGLADPALWMIIYALVTDLFPKKK